MSTLPSSKSELQETLKTLKEYRAILRSVGGRGQHLFHLKRSGAVEARVEYFGEINQSTLEPLVRETYQTHFASRPETIVWKRNDRIKGGLRIFLGDDMVDVSFQGVEKKFR